MAPFPPGNSRQSRLGSAQLQQQGSTGPPTTLQPHYIHLRVLARMEITPAQSFLTANCLKQIPAHQTLINLSN